MKLFLFLFKFSLTSLAISPAEVYSKSPVFTTSIEIMALLSGMLSIFCLFCPSLKFSGYARYIFYSSWDNQSANAEGTSPFQGFLTPLYDLYYPPSFLCFGNGGLGVGTEDWIFNYYGFSLILPALILLFKFYSPKIISFRSKALPFVFRNKGLFYCLLYPPLLLNYSQILLTSLLRYFYKTAIFSDISFKLVLFSSHFFQHSQLILDYLLSTSFSFPIDQLIIQKHQFCFYTTFFISSLIVLILLSIDLILFQISSLMQLKNYQSYV